MNPFTGYGLKGEMLEAGDSASGEREQHILRPVVDSQPHFSLPRIQHGVEEMHWGEVWVRYDGEAGSKATPSLLAWALGGWWGHLPTWGHGRSCRV